jgi:hypothetical protein
MHRKLAPAFLKYKNTARAETVTFVARTSNSDKNLGKPVAELFLATRYAAISAGLYACRRREPTRAQSYLITPQAIRAPPPPSGAGASE